LAHRICFCWSNNAGRGERIGKLQVEICLPYCNNLGMSQNHFRKNRECVTDLAGPDMTRAHPNGT
jgi:hypothetical protein